MRRSLGIVAGLALVLALVGGWWLRRDAAPPPAGSEPSVVADVPSSTASVPSAAARSPSPTAPGLPRASVAGTPARVVLPRPAPLDGGSGEAPRVIRIASGDGVLRDRRESPGPDAPTEMELIRAGLDTVGEDVEACLDAWAKSDARVDASVMIGFLLDEGGLTESWVEGASELPFGVQTCFANAVYGVDWSHIVSKPGQITNRYEIHDLRDAGT